MSVISPKSHQTGICAGEREIAPRVSHVSEVSFEVCRLDGDEVPEESFLALFPFSPSYNVENTIELERGETFWESSLRYPLGFGSCRDIKHCACIYENR